jgi:hypothetical protein
LTEKTVQTFYWTCDFIEAGPIEPLPLVSS